MKKVLIELKVADLRAALQFYCEELALFDVRQDYGMNTVSVAYKANPSILLLLSEGTPAGNQAEFSIEVDERS